MDNLKRPQALLRKRKMMIVMPILVLPFITMAFWAMGGGKSSTNTTGTIQQKGLNLQLPNAIFKNEKLVDKMSFYDQADRDSIKLADLVRKDPYYHHDINRQPAFPTDRQQITQNTAGRFDQLRVQEPFGLKTSPYDKSGDPTEQNVMKKLAELNEIINQPERNISVEKHNNPHKDESGRFAEDVNRLENMMKSMGDHENSNDPEMQQLESTLDKILDVQHPERVKGRFSEKSLSNKETVYAISKTPEVITPGLIDTAKAVSPELSGFFSLDDVISTEESNNVVEAVINESQVMVNGSVVKFRLVNDVYLSGTMIPKGTRVFGIASLNGERLEIEVNSIRYQQSIYPVKLQVYDIDGLPGIYIPGAITRDVAKQSVDNTLQLMELSTMDPSLKAQATAAGIEAAKTLLSKNVKQIKVVVKAGYRVLLKDRNLQQ